MKIINDVVCYNKFYGTHKVTNLKNAPTYSSTVKALPYNDIAFGARVNYGTPSQLPEALQQKVKTIYKHINLIQNFFLNIATRNPQLSSKIKKEYMGLVPKRQSGFIFKLPDTKDTLEVMKSQTRENILYISIHTDRPEFNGIVIDGYDKLIANVLKLHPHMLPQKLKYMNEERIANAEPEKFINLALEKIQGYTDYIKGLQTGEIPLPKLEQKTSQKTGLLMRKEIQKTAPSKEENTDIFDAKIKDLLNKLATLFSTDTKDLPEHLTPKTSPKGSILGFKLKGDDGSCINVMKKAIASYGDSMPYLSIERINKDNTRNYISIDLISNKILRTKESGKPHISPDHVVYELSPEELKRRKIAEKLDYYIAQIFKKESDNKGVVIEETIKEVKETQESTELQNKKTDVIESLVDIEKIKSKMRNLGKRDGSLAAAEYFNSFKEQFINDLREKMSTFNKEIENIINSIEKI